MIRLYYDVDHLNTIQMKSIAIFAPISGTGDTERRNSMVPKRVAVRLSFDYYYMASLLSLVQPVKTVEAGLCARLPAEAITYERYPEPYRQLFTPRSKIRNAQGRLAVVRQLRKSTGLQEVERQRLCGCILF